MGNQEDTIRDRHTKCVHMRGDTLVLLSKCIYGVRIYSAYVFFYLNHLNENCLMSFKKLKVVGVRYFSAQHVSDTNFHNGIKRKNMEDGNKFYFIWKLIFQQTIPMGIAGWIFWDSVIWFVCDMFSRLSCDAMGFCERFNWHGLMPYA